MHAHTKPYDQLCTCTQAKARERGRSYLGPRLATLVSDDSSAHIAVIKSLRREPEPPACGAAPMRSQTGSFISDSSGSGSAHTGVQAPAVQVSVSVALFQLSWGARWRVDLPRAMILSARRQRAKLPSAYPKRTIDLRIQKQVNIGSEKYGSVLKNKPYILHNVVY